MFPFPILPGSEGDLEYAYNVLHGRYITTMVSTHHAMMDMHFLAV